MISLAVKYRPSSFDDLTEQTAVKAILTNQIETKTIKHGYLFCGGAGTGKTTSARIFASMINKGKGTPIELDAASNNSVDDIRRLCDDAQTQSLDSEYKVFILDEVHSLSNQAWQAMLKTLEEPPAKSVFILCTTNPEKIPSTILSRVQRYDFQRISQKGIVDRLTEIVIRENSKDYDDPDLRDIGNIRHDKDAIEYIAKIADGGMRDAITLMDKCLSYSEDLTLDNVIKALGVADYNTMFDLLTCICTKDEGKLITIINDVFYSGVDLKLFCKTFFEFILDLNVYRTTKDLSNTKIPSVWSGTLGGYSTSDWKVISGLLSVVLSINNEVKWEQNPKPFIIAEFMIYVEGL